MLPSITDALKPAVAGEKSHLRPLEWSERETLVEGLP